MISRWACAIGISICFAISVAGAAPSQTALQVKNWKAADVSAIRFPGRIYLGQGRGKRRFVVTHAFSVQGKAFTKSLQNLDEVQANRIQFLSLFGISRYQILNHRQIQVRGFGKAEELEIRYLAPNGQVQSAVERQYVSASRALVTTYIEEVPTLSDIDVDRANGILDSFRIQLESRANFPLFENLAEFLIEPAVAADDLVARSVGDGNSPTQSDFEKLHIAMGPLPAYCEEVPEKFRRTTNDITKWDSVQTSDFSDCPEALKTGAMGLVNLLDNIDRTTGNGGQLIASAGTAAANLYNDPKAMARRIVTRLFNFRDATSKVIGKYAYCLNAKGAATTTCESIPALVASDALGRFAAGGKLAKEAAAKEIATTLEKNIVKSGAAEGHSATAITGHRAWADAAAKEAGVNEVKDPFAEAENLSESQKLTSPLQPLSERPLQPEETSLKDTSKIVNREPIRGSNLTEAVKVTYSDGTQGIWKPRDPTKYASNYRAEVLAYEVDRSFGINLVPPTVEAKIDGAVGSVQLFKPGKISRPSLAAETDINKQSLLDYLIDNRGRHSSNYLVEDNGAVHSIDNGESFTGKGFNGRSFSDRVHELDPLLKSPEGQKIMQKIETYGTKPAFRAELEKYLGPKDADQMMRRIQLLIKYNARLNN